MRANAALLALLRLDRQLAVGKLVATLVAVGSRRELRRLLRRRAESASLSIELQTHSRERVPVRLLAGRAGSGMLLTFVDRRRELRAVARARQSERRLDRLAGPDTSQSSRGEGGRGDGGEGLSTRLRRLLQGIPQGLLGVDEQLRVTEANDAAKQLFGTAAPVHKRVRAWQGFALDDFVRSLYDEEDAQSAEAAVTTADGREVRLLAMLTEDRSLAMILATDVTERERRELAERDFVANAAHELRSPIAAIISAVDALELGAKDDPETRDRFMRHVAREADRMQLIVHALLELAYAQHRGEAPELRAVRLREFLERISARLSPADGVEVEVLCADGLTVSTNSELLMLAVGNAAANAARFTVEGRIRLSARPVRGRVAFEIADSGPGIAAEERALVLERFYRSRPSGAGSGLGLSIVRQAVEALGGELELGEAREGGTLVRFSLPAAEQA